ncbi:hypothetical protein RND81_12G108000 [Saponaria officinalis]|uniref:Uncharacterized protein n=1 Tax=Saponaria officinalis TaxID=3572 RepID=A0AAW1H918_SAPOF
MGSILGVDGCCSEGVPSTYKAEFLATLADEEADELFKQCSFVKYSTHVKLKKRGSDTKYVATVLAIGNECDLALLTDNDDEFWDGVSPVEFGKLPALQDAVIVVGYPIGGDTISVTSGVVSRIEILSYVHGSTELLGLQIDAAINSGNSVNSNSARS